VGNDFCSADIVFSFHLNDLFLFIIFLTKWGGEVAKCAADAVSVIMVFISVIMVVMVSKNQFIFATRFKRHDE